MSVCKYCDKEFHDKARPNSRQCGSCTVSKRRWKNKIRYVEMKGGKCERCGYDAHPGALQFHHTRDKSFQISANRLLLKDETILPELNKCILLCGNCHAIEHSNYDRFKQDLE